MTGGGGIEGADGVNVHHGCNGSDFLGGPGSGHSGCLLSTGLVFGGTNDDFLEKKKSDVPNHPLRRHPPFRPYPAAVPLLLLYV